MVMTKMGFGRMAATDEWTLDLEASTQDLAPDQPERTSDLTSADLMAEESANSGDAEEDACKQSLDRALSTAADRGDASTSDETMSCWDATRVPDGPEDQGYHQTELWYRERDLTTVLRMTAPAGNYEIWVHRGLEADFMAWRCGAYGTSWKSEPFLRATKTPDGTLHIREIEAEQDNDIPLDDLSVGFPW